MHKSIPGFFRVLGPAGYKERSLLGVILRQSAKWSSRKRKLWVDESSAYKVDVTTVHCGYSMCAQRIKNSGVKWCGKSCKLTKPALGVFL